MSETREQAIERWTSLADIFDDHLGTAARRVIVEVAQQAMSFERERIREKVKAEISQEHDYMDTCCVRATKKLLEAIEGED